MISKKKYNNLEHQLTTVPVKIKMGGAKMITGRHWLTVNLLTNKLVDSCGGCYEE
jgi:hypothetical protein